MNIINIFKLLRRKSLFICLLIAYTICSSAVFSQISEGGAPPSFNYPLSSRSAGSATKVPVDFYIEDLRETDQWKAREGVPLQVSKLITVDYSMENSGYYTQLPGGENIWRLHLTAKDAVAIMLYYNDFYIPEGGRLFIYNPDKSQLLGAYTHRTHPSGGLFATEFIGGDELILEYVASETSAEKPRIAIGEIGYGYNTAALRAFCNITPRATSVECNININCEEGQAWQNEKKSVCYTVQRIGTGTWICTGSLMNNTAVDFKPLILTAAHCAYNGKNIASAKDMEQWLFYFNRELEGCSNSTKPKISNTMIGCTLLTNTGLAGGSDGMLVLLKNVLPDYFDVFYNGWDRSGEAALSGVCIHHPQGDYKKISTFDEPAKTYTYISSDFRGDSEAHWNVFFKATTNGFGVTEGGSSGSPLYNENKLVVGTLTGGSSPVVCYDTKMLNIYGKLSYHWDRYKTDSTRMDVWLDPLNTGVKTFPGRFKTELKPAPLNLRAVNLGQSVSLAWDAPQSAEAPNGYNVYRNNVKMAETTSLAYIDNDPIMGSITYSVSAVYDEEESAFTSAILYLIKYKAPYDLIAERPTPPGTQVEVSWKAPVYEQTIYWGTMMPTYMIGFDEKTPFYFGQQWDASEIAALHNKSIKAVQFFPIESNTYDVYIVQGEHAYRQPIETASLKQRELNTIELNTPFVIDGSMSLIVSIFTSDVVTDYPAVCDEGPAVNGKGNICSTDGIEWYLLNDGEEPGDFDYNFVVTAIVTSESGHLSVDGKNTDIALRRSLIKANYNALQPRKSVLSFDDYHVSLRSSLPAAFPEITRYRVYRSGSFFKEVNAPVTSCEDNYLINTIYYQVSAFYDQIESEKSDIAYITVVNNEYMDAAIRIIPTRFTNMITLQGYEYVSRIEAISVSGKVMLTVNRPNQQLDTSSLPPGLYFFRIYDVFNKQQLIKAIKII